MEQMIKSVLKSHGELNSNLGSSAARSIIAKEIIEKMHDERQNFYEGLSTFKTFGKGWTRRNQETKEASLQILQNA